MKVAEYDRLHAKKREKSALLQFHKRMDQHMRTALAGDQMSKAKEMNTKEKNLKRPGSKQKVDWTSAGSKIGGKGCSGDGTGKKNKKSKGRDGSVIVAANGEILQAWEEEMGEQAVQGGCCRAGGCCSDANEEAADRHSEKQTLRPSKKQYFFDYNTVEQMLLASAILVCLAGIMFENERFEERKDLEYQKDIITYVVIGVIFFSIFYYCVVFVAEVFAWHPAFLLRIFASKSMRKEAKRAKKADDVDRDVNDLDDEVRGDDAGCSVRCLRCVDHCVVCRVCVYVRLSQRGSLSNSFPNLRFSSCSVYFFLIRL